MALGVGYGDEVIIPAFSYIATAEAAAILGAVPVYIDIDPASYSLDPNMLENAITSKTKAIVPVSLYGIPSDFDAINKIASRYSIPVIEDAAQSFGSQYKDLKSCNLSTIACTSFFPTKPLGCYGDGGAVFTSDFEFAKLVRQIAQHGQEKRYYHTRIGMNSRLDTLQAAVLLAKLKILDLEIAEREKVAERYSNEFEKNKQVITPIVPSGCISAWGQYTIRVPNRDRVQKALLEAGISSVVHYPMPLSAQPAVAKKAEVPESEKAAATVLSLPVFGTLSEKIQNIIIETVIGSV